MKKLELKGMQALTKNEMKKVTGGDTCIQGSCYGVGWGDVSSCDDLYDICGGIDESNWRCIEYPGGCAN